MTQRGHLPALPVRHVLRGAADAGTLLMALAVTVVGWPIRRIVPTWG